MKTHLFQFNDKAKLIQAMSKKKAEIKVFSYVRTAIQKEDDIYHGRIDIDCKPLDVMFGTNMTCEMINPTT